MKKIPKRWRELSIKQKLSIPEKYFKIDRKEIEKIRKISDPKKRLIEAARIQYELFKDIHTYLTVWIAGYASDITIRQYFNSTSNLLKIFMKDIPLDKKGEFSWADIKRSIKIPVEMTNDLAEETGIHLGDGNLTISTEKAGYKSYRYSISGDLTDEYFYHVTYIANLMKDIYNARGIFIKRPNKNSIDSKYNSKAIVNFKNKFLGLPVGSKKNAHIPKIILEDNEFSKRCVCGIIDTDFNITSSLAISGKLHSLHITKEMHEILERNNIKHVFRVYKDYARFYISKKEAIKIVKEWQLHNLKHLSKYAIFEKFGKFLPYTTTSERLALLNKKLNLDDLEKISKSRKLNKMLTNSYIKD